MATEFTQQTVLEFLSERGGTVRQPDLIDHFESIRKNDGSDQKLDRDVLLGLVDRVALVKLVDGVRMVCLKKSESCTTTTTTTTNGHDGEECNGNGVYDAAAAAAGGMNPLSDHHHQLGEQRETTPEQTERLSINLNTMQKKQGEPMPASSDTNKNSNIEDKGLNNSDDNGNNHLCIEKEPSPVPHGEKTVVDFPPPGEVKLRERRRRESAPVIGLEPDPAAYSGGLLPGQVRPGGGRRVSRGSQRALLTSGLSEDSAWEGLVVVDPGCVSGDGNTPKGSRRNFIELMMSSSPQVRRSMIQRSSRLRDSVRSDSDSASLLSADGADGVSVTLDPLEHEWMLCASDGLWDSLWPLLAVEPSLVSKRDFVTGFTCLHWAAKQGKQELLAQLLAFAKENSVHVDVNARSSAGYTALHLAAMHGHTQVVRSLMSDWDADSEARDYSGKKASQYLPSVATADSREGSIASPGTDSDTENTESGTRTSRWRLPKVLQANLNPLRLLNMPSEGTGGEAGGTGKSKQGIYRKSSLSRINARLHRGRHRTQIIHSTSFRESGEVEREDNPPATSPLKARPLSNLFG